MLKKKMENIIDFETSGLLFTILLIPEKFKDVLILEDPEEIENFDIGYENFYLMTNNSISILNDDIFEDPDNILKKLRSKYHVYKKKPEIIEGHTIKFFKRKLVSKMMNLLGEVLEDKKLNYNWRVKQILKGVENDIDTHTSTNRIPTNDEAIKAYKTCWLYEK